MTTAIRQFTQSGGYIHLAAHCCPTLRVNVRTADEASAAMRHYIEFEGLGGSDLKPRCGSIFSNDNKLVARVSYNGRVWDPAGNLLQDIEGGLLYTGPHA
jgi:hypothetical protein